MLQLKLAVSTAALVCAFSNASLGASTNSKIAPSKLEAIGDTGMKRITLTEHAARRIGVATVNVQEEYVQQNRKISGIVTKLGVANGVGIAFGTVSVKGLQHTGTDCERNVRFVAMSDHDWSNSLAAQMPDIVLTGGVDTTAVDYLFENKDGAVTLGTQVFVEVCIADTVGQAQVIPQSALLYSAEGKTWVYTEESPLTYVRAPVDVAWIDGARVILKNGPPVGSAIVTTGSVELFGEEFGIGH
jgi:hypothetical protein